MPTSEMCYLRGVVPVTLAVRVLSTEAASPCRGALYIWISAESAHRSPAGIHLTLASGRVMITGMLFVAVAIVGAVEIASELVVSGG